VQIQEESPSIIEIASQSRRKQPAQVGTTLKVKELLLATSMGGLFS